MTTAGVPKPDGIRRGSFDFKFGSRKMLIPMAGRRGSASSTISTKRRQSISSVDWRLERMKKKSFIARLWFDVKVMWRSSPWTMRGTMETAVALFYLFFVPYQIGFETDVQFNTLYAICYTLDSLLVLSIASKQVKGMNITANDQSMDMSSSSRASIRGASGRGESERSTGESSTVVMDLSSRGAESKPPAAPIFKIPPSVKKKIFPVSMLLLALPFDALLWATSARESIPFVRLTRYAYALMQSHLDLVYLERSQFMPFGLTRMTRMLGFNLVLTHCLACFFFYFTTRPGADHFSTAPWLSSHTANPGVTTRYLRSMYWSFMTFTTVGHVDIVARDVDDPGMDWEVGAHVDIVARDVDDPGMDWEVGAAIVVAVVATFAYIYINANFTTMMIRLNSRLEQYRAQLAGIDAYLTRNKVSKDVCKRVKRHFARSQQATASADKALLDSLPGSLQREVLQDIHMRTLRAASTFINLDPAALAQVCAVVRSVTYLPEEILVQQGDVVTEMYFLEEGSILYVSILEMAGEEDDEDERQSSPGGRNKLVKTPTASSLLATRSAKRPSLEAQRTEKMLKHRGAPMCELAFLFGVRQEATLEAVSMSKCCSLQKADYMALTQEFPDILDQAQCAVLAQMRQNNDPLLQEVERMQTKSEKQIAKLADMLFASAAGKLEVVQEAVEQGGVDVNEADYEGRTAMHIAASSSQLAILDFLVSRRANVNRKDSFGKTPLANAVAKGHEQVASILHNVGGELGWDEAEMASELCEKAREGDNKRITLLLACNARVNAADYDSRTCLHLAASEGNFKVCELLLKHNADVNVTDRWGGTPLRDAIREGHDEVAKLLRGEDGELNYDEANASGELCELARLGLAARLDLLLHCGCDVNAADYDARTCLHLAASVGNLPIVQRLVELKADVNARDRWGGTPLRDAVREGHPEVARALSGFGGLLGHDEAEVSGELCELAKQGDVEKLEVLLSCGVYISAADYDQRTCLHLAASEGKMEIVKRLLSHKADVNVRDRWGGTPLSDAVREGHNDIALVIKDNGGQLGMDDLAMGTALCEFARDAKIDKLQAMVRCGASVNNCDHEGRTALHVAAAEGHKAVVEALLALGATATIKDRGGYTPRQEAEPHGWPASLWGG
eukprot:CAMPEP_0113246232 /NCGR_PEP_ID=MMETSP0008_2-20120614/9358_1 /TAXON_ID=97485 /ORGANISM="Prymnesium parvum" /LENGTH=1137 /DNA_ID=CAMNT_0000093969 /DNA_START=33 /DNA_END=3446 /DNA_ORIENTATION=- /assembly_acc=CAM_ASM_000153